MAGPLDLWQASDLLRARLRDNNPTPLPIIYENDEADKPSANGMIYCEIVPTGSEQATINMPGLREFRDMAMFTIVVCIPRGGKISQAEQWAAAIRKLFNPDVFMDSHVKILDRRMMKLAGSRVASKWHMVGVSVSFHTTRLE